MPLKPIEQTTSTIHPEPAPESGGHQFAFGRLLDDASAMSHLPLYQKLAGALHTAIRSGALRAGDGIPPERVLASMLGVSRITVRRATEWLAQQGLIQARRGSGTIVTVPHVEQALSDLGSFSENMARRGLVPGSRWISRDMAFPSPEEILALALTPNDRIIRMVRVRTANGAPMAVERSVVKAEDLGGEVEFGNSLYDALRYHGVSPYRALQRLRAEIVSSEDAGFLGLDDGAPVLATERRSFNAEGKAIEFTRAVYRGDCYDYVVELRTASTSKTFGDSPMPGSGTPS